MPIASKLFIRRLSLSICDMLIITVSYYFSYRLTLELRSHGFDDYAKTFFATLPLLLSTRILCGILVRQYTWAFRQASLIEAVGVAKASLAGSILFFLLCHYSTLLPPLLLKPPRSAYITEFMLSLIGMEGIRFLPRYFYQKYLQRGAKLAPDGETKLRTLVYGAGDTGVLVVRDLLRTHIYPYNIIGFVDDDPGKWSNSIQGYRVFGSIKDLPEIVKKHEIDKILIAIPGITAAKLRKVVDICSDTHIRFKLVPNYAELVAKGNAGLLMLKDVSLEDLLERTPVSFDHSTMAELFVDKTVLVTGAAGSIGSEICRQLSTQGIKRLIALDLNENDLYFLKLDLDQLAPALELHLEIANIRDAKRLQAIFATRKPHIVFHAAAHKHVPLIENCPSEGLKNNVLGTLNVAKAADMFATERFVLISTDKSVRPTNVMGATKCLAEFITRNLNFTSKTKFMAVRFGNVLGSNGSLIQILNRQIAAGGPVTITHPKITRFFMTIPEAVGLVLVASLQTEGSLYVLDMGEPLSVDRLAREMISLSGLIPDHDIEIVYTGLRPGEKMHEELFAHTETHSPSSHPKINIVSPAEPEFNLEEMLSELNQIIIENKEDEIGIFLQKYVPGYQPAVKT